VARPTVDNDRYQRDAQHRENQAGRVEQVVTIEGWKGGTW
jgi:hypothetical protein